MQLEDYFDFLAPDDIRIKGHRIGIETCCTSTSSMLRRLTNFNGVFQR